MTTIEPRRVGGWYLPGRDSYFDRFVNEHGQKENGFQREHLEAALRFVTRWDYAIDVGAHIGFWTKDMAEKFGKVYAFEAAPDTFACLAKNMAEFPNVVATNVAVGHEEGRCTVNDGDRSHDSGNTGSRYVKMAGDGPTRMVSLDSLELPGCDFLKVDVEGFESFVLRGAKKLIAAHWPIISMETDKSFSEGRYRVANTEAEHFLLKRGYRCVAHMRPDKVFIHDV